MSARDCPEHDLRCTPTLCILDPAHPDYRPPAKADDIDGIKRVVEGLVRTSQMHAENSAKLLGLAEEHHARIAQLEQLVEYLQRRVAELDNRTLGSLRAGGN